MERKFTKKWSSRNVTVKVTNRECGRVDIHKNISREEVSWIEANPHLDVEIMEYNIGNSRYRKKNKERSE